MSRSRRYLIFLLRRKVSDGKPEKRKMSETEGGRYNIGRRNFKSKLVSLAHHQLSAISRNWWKMIVYALTNSRRLEAVVVDA